MNTPINDGGPAFPGFAGITGYGLSRPVSGPNGEVLWESYDTGMTLRDYFAGMALPAKITDAETFNEKEKSNRINKEDVADSCYRYADAMLAQRDK